MAASRVLLQIVRRSLVFCNCGYQENGSFSKLRAGRFTSFFYHDAVGVRFAFPCGDTCHAVLDRKNNLWASFVRFDLRVKQIGECSTAQVTTIMECTCTPFSCCARSYQPIMAIWQLCFPLSFCVLLFLTSSLFVCYRLLLSTRRKIR